MKTNTLHNVPLAAFAETLSNNGIVAGLEFLNARVAHRCTGIYKLEGADIRSVYLYDRQGQLRLESLGTVPLKESFCELAIRDGLFLTTYSALDERANGRVMKGVVAAYCGIPLLDRSGQLFGSLCHFDFVSATLDSDEFEFMQKAAGTLAQYL